MIVLSEEHLLRAIANWGGTPVEHRPTKWVVLYEGLPYPPKLLVARAALYAIGQYWQPHLFSGGRDLHRFIQCRLREAEIVELAALSTEVQRSHTLCAMS